MVPILSPGDGYYLMIYRFCIYGKLVNGFPVKNTALPMVLSGKNAHVVPLHTEETNTPSPGNVSHLSSVIRCFCSEYLMYLILVGPCCLQTNDCIRKL